MTGQRIDNQIRLGRLTSFLIENSREVRERNMLTVQDRLADKQLVSEMLDLFDGALKSVNSPCRTAERADPQVSRSQEEAENVLQFPGLPYRGKQYDDLSNDERPSIDIVGPVTHRSLRRYIRSFGSMAHRAIRSPVAPLSLAGHPSMIAATVFATFAIASVFIGIIGGSKITPHDVSEVETKGFIDTPTNVPFSERWLLDPRNTEKLPTLAKPKPQFAGDGTTLVTPEVMIGPPGHYYKRRVVEGDSGANEGKVSYSLEECAKAMHPPLVCYLPRKQNSDVQRVGPNLLRDKRD